MVMNMTYPLFFVPCLFVLFFSSFLSISGSHWVVVWCGLAMNLISVVAIMSLSGGGPGLLIYFLIQGFSSVVLLIVGLLFSIGGVLVKGVFLFCLFVKLGVAPFHFWVGRVFTSFGWGVLFIVGSWQKLVPLWLLGSLVVDSSLFVGLIGAVSVVVGGVGAMNSSSMKLLMGYSSVTHSGWLVVISMFSLVLMMYYLFFYSVVMGCCMYYFFKGGLSSVGGDWFVVVRGPVLSLLMLSLGGIPPFFGFLPKLMVIQELTGFSVVVFWVMLLFFVGSVLSLYAYMKVVLKSSMVLGVVEFSLVGGGVLVWMMMMIGVFGGLFLNCVWWS